MNPLQETFGGLVLGESLSWTGLFDRSFLLPFWTRRKRREIELAYETENLLEVSLPFALNQPTDAFEPGPGPHSEWFMFQLQVFSDSNGTYSLNKTLERWRLLAEDRSALRAFISQHAALSNLQAGKRPPVTGYDNPHYFDDAACFRALALGCLLNDHETALQAVEQDAGISNAEDGLWGAKAVAAATVAAIRSRNADACVAAASQHLPEGSWIHRMMTRALEHATTCPTVFDLTTKLNQDIVNDTYNYGNAAAETVPITLAILKHTSGDPERALLAALALPRTAGSVVPLTAALCGALGRLPNEVERHAAKPLRGIALPALAGTILTTRLQELAITT